MVIAQCHYRGRPARSTNKGMHQHHEIHPQSTADNLVPPKKALSPSPIKPMGVLTCKCSWKRIGKTCAMAPGLSPNYTKSNEKRPFEIAKSEKISQINFTAVSSENTFDNQHGVHVPMKLSTTECNKICPHMKRNKIILLTNLLNSTLRKLGSGN